MVIKPLPDDRAEKIAQLMQDAASLGFVLQPVTDWKATLGISIARHMCHRAGEAVYQTIDFTIHCPRLAAVALLPSCALESGTQESHTMKWQWTTYDQVSSLLSVLLHRLRPQ
eukprot:4333937-Prymnesium_polylepis.2